MYKGFEMLQIFVADSREMIDSIEPQLLGLRNSGNFSDSLKAETLDSVFRLFHTLKGCASSLGLENIASLTRLSEPLLDLFCERKETFQAGHVTLFLKVIDLIRRYLREVEGKRSDLGFEEEKKLLEQELILALGAQRNETASAPKIPEKEPIPDGDGSTSLLEVMSSPKRIDT